MAGSELEPACVDLLNAVSDNTRRNVIAWLHQEYRRSLKKGTAAGGGIGKVTRSRPLLKRLTKVLLASVPYSLSKRATEALQATDRVGPGLSFAVADQGADRAMQSMAGWLQPTMPPCSADADTETFKSSTQLVCGDVLVEAGTLGAADEDMLEITPTNAFLDAIDAGLVPESVQATALNVRDALTDAWSPVSDTSDAVIRKHNASQAWLRLVLTGADAAESGSAWHNRTVATGAVPDETVVPAHAVVRHARVRAGVQAALDTEAAERMERAAGVKADALSASAKRFRQHHAASVAEAVGMRIDVLGGLFDGHDVSILHSSPLVESRISTPVHRRTGSPSVSDLVTKTMSMRKRRSRLSIGLPSFWVGNGAHPMLVHGIQAKGSMSKGSKTDQAQEAAALKRKQALHQAARARSLSTGKDEPSDRPSGDIATTETDVPPGPMVKIRSFTGEVLRGATPSDQVETTEVSPLVAGSSRLIRTTSMKRGAMATNVSSPG